MTTRSEKERQKAQQEKFQAILSNLLKDEDNKYCVDCDAKGPRWASWNLGVFLCIRCAGIHRNLGVHISKVKSVNLDTWTPEQVAMMMEIGNSRARAAYEANLPDNYRRPQGDSALENFIRSKYEQKKYLAKEWVQPKPVVPKELLEDDRDKKRTKQKSSGNITLTAVPRSQAGSSSSTQSASSSSTKPNNPKPVQNVKAVPPQQPAAPPPGNTSSAGDLIGLVFAQPTSVDSLDAPSAPSTSTSNSLLDDFMGAGSPKASQPTLQTDNSQLSNGGLEANLFGDSTASADKQPNVSTKDSIMALYGGQQAQPQFGVPASSTNPFLNESLAGLSPVPNYGVPLEPQYMFTFVNTGGMYMPQQQQQQQQQGMPGMYNMQQPQQGMYGNQMGMMGMQQGAMGMQGMGNMGMMPPQTGMGMGQPTMGMPQAAMGMYTPQSQMQQMQFNQMQSQMAGMTLGQQPAMSGMGWGGPQNSGHTLSTNLWQ